MPFPVNASAPAPGQAKGLHSDLSPSISFACSESHVHGITQETCYGIWLLCPLLCLENSSTLLNRSGFKSNPQNITELQMNFQKKGNSFAIPYAFHFKLSLLKTLGIYTVSLSSIRKLFFQLELSRHLQRHHSQLKGSMAGWSGLRVQKIRPEAMLAHSQSFKFGFQIHFYLWPSFL